MTDTRTTTDDGRTDGKTTRSIRALARTDSESSESDSATIDPKDGGKED
jgi:hypothetical protein